MSGIVEGPKIAALSCGKPAFLVVLLHGEGSEGAAIIQQALNWAPTMPKADFLALEAPLSGPGGVGRSWFEAGELAQASPEAVSRAAALLNDFLDEALAARRLPDSHLALVGFSQGAMVALCAALQRQKRIAAVVSFAGALPEGAPTGVRSAPPVLMIHGEDDDQLPFAVMSATKERLKAAGVPVKSMRRRGIGHVMDDEGVLAAGDFLTVHVAHPPAADADHHNHAH